MRRVLLLGVLAVLASCGTPQEQCISRNTKDLRTLDRLIKETEGNIARGYALVEVRVPDYDYFPCPRPMGVGPGGRAVYGHGECLRHTWDIEQRPKAIDIDAEKAKLASMKKKRTTLARRAESVVTQCRAIYPD